MFNKYRNSKKQISYAFAAFLVYWTKNNIENNIYHLLTEKIIAVQFMLETKFTKKFDYLNLNKVCN